MKPISEGYVGAVPYICVRGAAEAIDFYCRAFGATQTERIDQPNGRIGHAEIRSGMRLPYSARNERAFVR